MKTLITTLLACTAFATLASPAHALIVKNEKVILEKFEDYEFCQTKDYTGGWCQRALEDWVQAHPQDAMKAGKITRRKMNHWAAIPFFKMAFDAKKGDCKDEDVKLAVISALNLTADGQSNIVPTAKNIGLNLCEKEMGAAIAKASAEDGITFKNTCKELQAKKLIQLGAIQKKKCESGE